MTYSFDLLFTPANFLFSTSLIKVIIEVSFYYCLSYLTVLLLLLALLLLSIFNLHLQLGKLRQESFAISTDWDF